MKHNNTSKHQLWDSAYDQSFDLSFFLKPFYFILLIWFVFWLDMRFMLDLYQFGILPRHFSGLVGIVSAPLLHGSLMHLTNNTLPLLALGTGLFYFYPRIALPVVLYSWLSSGITVWIIGRESYHIGASGLIYALAGFIFLSGILRKQSNLLALSLLVVFLYGSLVWGILPVQETVSWEAHLAGASCGFALALYYRKTGPRRRRYSWELEEEIRLQQEEERIPDELWKQPLEEDDDNVWENYSGSLHGIRYIYKPRTETESRSKDENSP